MFKLYRVKVFRETNEAQIQRLVFVKFYNKPTNVPTQVFYKVGINYFIY